MTRSLSLGILLASASGPAFALEYECPPLTDDCYEPDKRVQEAVSLQVTSTGLNRAGEAAIAVLPDLLDGLSDGLPDELTVPVVVDLQNLQIAIIPTDLILTPIPTGNKAVIQADIIADLNLNTQSEQYSISGLICLFDSGTGWVQATAKITAQVEIQFRAGGDPTINVVIPNNYLQVTNGPGCPQCGVSAFGDCTAILNNIGPLIQGLQPLLRPTLVTAISDALAGIGDALSALNIEQDVELLGKTLTLSIGPQRSYSTANGIDLTLNGLATAAPDVCIADVDPGGSFRTKTNVPSVDDNPPGAEVVVLAADDFLNQAAYAAFRSGLLCLTVDETLLGDTELPIPIDSTLVPLITGSFGDAYREILPVVPTELLIKTRPRQVPSIKLDTAYDVAIEATDLEVGFFTQLEERQARAVGLSVTANAGVDLLFDDTTGELLIDLDLAEDLDLQIGVVEEILVAGAENEIPGSVGNLINTLLPALLGDTLSDLSFAIPSFEGIGLAGLTISAGGPQGDWLRVDASLGAVEYGAGGCEGEGGGGCGDAGGCGGGCANGGVNPLGAGLLTLVPFVLLRRRSRASSR